VRKLVGDGKLAARLNGTENRDAQSDQECPICFLHYSEVNVTKCCNAYICTECYLQVRPPKEKATTCPFCNHHKLTVIAAKAMDQAAMNERDAEEQMFIEAKLRDRSNNNSSSMPATPPATPTECSGSGNSPTTSASEQAPAQFGSFLAQNERVANLRARSESIASESSFGNDSNTTPDIASVAMTPAERQLLEEEMRAQHNHPVAMRLEAEEAERRLNNEREYYRAQTGRLRELRARREQLHHTMMADRNAASGGAGGAGADNSDGQGHIRMTLPPTSPSSRRRHRQSQGAASASDNAAAGSHAGGPLSSRMGRDWNRIVDAFESSGNGSIQSLDDLVVLEAAIMLSMEEETRRRGEGGGNTDSNSNEGGGGSQEDGDDVNVDAARHARDGFPLARDRISRQLAGEGDDEMNNQVQSLMRGINRRRNRGSSSRESGRNNSGHHDNSMDTASMLMRGITEEQQIAMAIAASLEESSNGQTRTPSEDASGETSENDQQEPSSAAVASTTEEAPPTQDGALAESASETPAEAISAMASIATSGNEPSVITSVEEILLSGVEVAVDVEEGGTATPPLGLEDICASATCNLESLYPSTTVNESTPTPNMEDTKPSADLSLPNLRSL
jgi:hypothetical protein